VNNSTRRVAFIFPFNSHDRSHSISYIPSPSLITSHQFPRHFLEVIPATEFPAYTGPSLQPTVYPMPRIPITISPPSSSNLKLPPGLVKISHDEIMLIELQGSLEVDLNHPSERNGRLVGTLKIDEATVSTIVECVSRCDFFSSSISIYLPPERIFVFSKSRH
jgi:hypothetical protein